MREESEQLARRDRWMRHFHAQLTPEQRIARGRELHESAMRQLEANPEAFDRFMRRNLRKRAIDPHGQPGGV